MIKKEYLVQAPDLQGPCTVREVREDHIVLRVRNVPSCPGCTDADDFFLSWDEKAGFCIKCGYRVGSNIILH